MGLTIPLPVNYLFVIALCPSEGCTHPTERRSPTCSSVFIEAARDGLFGLITKPETWRKARRSHGQPDDESYKEAFF